VLGLGDDLPPDNLAGPGELGGDDPSPVGLPVRVEEELRAPGAEEGEEVVVGLHQGPERRSGRGTSRVVPAQVGHHHPVAGGSGGPGGDDEPAAVVAQPVTHLLLRSAVPAEDAYVVPRARPQAVEGDALAPGRRGPTVARGRLEAIVEEAPAVGRPAHRGPAPDQVRHRVRKVGARLHVPDPDLHPSGPGLRDPVRHQPAPRPRPGHRQALSGAQVGFGVQHRAGGAVPALPELQAQELHGAPTGAEAGLEVAALADGRRSVADHPRGTPGPPGDLGPVGGGSREASGPPVVGLRPGPDLLGAELLHPAVGRRDGNPVERVHQGRPPGHRRSVVGVGVRRLLRRGGEAGEHQEREDPARAGGLRRHRLRLRTGGSGRVDGKVRRIPGDGRAVGTNPADGGWIARRPGRRGAPSAAGLRSGGRASLPGPGGRSGSGGAPVPPGGPPGGLPVPRDGSTRCGPAGR